MLNKLSIKQKLYLIAIVPFCVYFSLSFILIDDKYNKKDQVSDIVSILELSSKSLALAESLQHERGYSMCFTKIQGKDLGFEKTNQRKITDKLSSDFLSIIDKYPNLETKLKSIKDDINSLDKKREHIDSFLLSTTAIKNSYGTLISKLIEIPHNIKTKDNELIVLSKLLDDISNTKNESSLERTILNSVILTNKFNISSLTDMIYSSSKQEHHLYNFDLSVYGKLKDFYNNKIMDSSFFEVQKIRIGAKQAISSSISSDINLDITSKQWCDVATQKLKILRQIEMKTLEHFKNVADSKYSELENSFHLFLVMLTLVMLLSYFISKRTIDDLDQSLSNLSVGLSSFFEFLNHKIEKAELINVVGNDEISKMSSTINDNILSVKNNLSVDRILMEHLSDLVIKIKEEDFTIEEVSFFTSNPILQQLQIDINELLKILSHKAHELKDYKENLEQIIIMKTHELEKLNKSLEDKVNDKTKELVMSNEVLEDEKNRLSNFTDFLSKLNSVDISYLCNGTLKHLVKVSSSLFGLMYIIQDDKLKLIATSSFDEEHMKLNTSTLEKMGVIYDSLENNRWISIENIDKDSLVSLDIGIANVTFSSFYVIPLSFQDRKLGVVVLGSYAKVNKSELDSYKKALENSLNNAVSYNLIQKQRLSLESANMELMRADKLKSEFLANMSHELRTPLNSVIGFSSILMKNKKGNLEEKQLGQIDKINKNGNHLLGLINDILDLSKIEAGKIEIDPIKTDIVSIVENTIGMLQGQAHNKSVKLLFENASEQSDIITFLDDNKFRQVLVNLVGNALKFVESGTGEVDVVLHLDDGQVRIDIEDNGIGIEADKLDLIFEAFRQADGSTTRNYGGTGLGLTISKSIIELLGGKITVKSVYGEGSTFSIYLPIASADGVVRKDNQKCNDSNDLIIKKSTINKILIVDDTSDSRDIVKEYLKDIKDLELIFAEDGDDGYKKALEHRPSLVITDIMMPKVNGWELLDMLNRNKELQDIPVIVVSNVSNEAKALSLGAIECLHKPISRDDLIATFKKNFKGVENSIMIVDDEQDVQDMMKDILSDNVKKIKTASNGEEALSILDSGFYPDLIYLDLMMPKMDGFKFLEIAKHHDKYKYIPIVVVSAKDLTLEEKAKLHNMNVSVISKGNDITMQVKKSLHII
jgi:signal transduction histidine kinase/DNA-binding response OmpR family regulator